MHDSYTPLGGLILMFLMQLGEVVFGGVGSGLYGMLMFVIFSVFLAGLMVGRTPEYLGKKIEAFEVKMASIAVLMPPAVVLLGAAIAAVTPDGLSGVQDAGPHGLQRDPLRLQLDGEQQRQRLRGLRREYADYQPHGRRRDVRCPLLGRACRRWPSPVRWRRRRWFRRVRERCRRTRRSSSASWLRSSWSSERWPSSRRWRLGPIAEHLMVAGS